MSASCLSNGGSSPSSLSMAAPGTGFRCRLAAHSQIRRLGHKSPPSQRSTRLLVSTLNMAGRCEMPSPAANAFTTTKRERQPRRYTRSTRPTTSDTAESTALSHYQSSHSKRHHPYRVQVDSGDGHTTPRRTKPSANQNVSALNEMSPRDKQRSARRRTDKLMTFLQSARERKIPVRSGKWHAEEDAYLSKLIELFSCGLLDNIPVKASMRSWLANMLNCCPMRISKKQMHGGQFEGKIKYVRNAQRIEELSQAEYDAACEAVVTLRAEFLMAWAKDELTRRQLHEQDSSFEEWYCKVLETVPIPFIAASTRISTTKWLQKNDSINQLNKSRVVSGPHFIPRKMPLESDAQTHMRLRSRAAAKRTLGDVLDELVATTSKEKPIVDTNSFGTEDNVWIKQEFLADRSYHTPPRRDAASQPFAEDCISEYPLSTSKSNNTVAAPSRAYRALPVLRFDLANPIYAQPPPTNNGQWSIDISIGSSGELVSRDIAAPTGRLLCGGADAQEEIDLLASDSDALPLEDLPFDSWLFESLMLLP